MNADELYTLLNDLPDDYVTAAAGTHRQSRRPPYVIVPAVAACITLLIAAAVYPKLRTQQPERREDSVYTETAAFTTALPEEQEPPAFTVSQTVQTTVSAVMTQTQTTAQSGTAQPVRQEHVTEQEPPDGKRETVTTYDSYIEVPDTETQITTANPGRQTSRADAVQQTVPYQLSKARAAVPYEESEPIPSTAPTEQPGGSIAPAETVRDPMQTELPVTSVIAAEETVAVTTAVTEHGEEPVPETTVPATESPAQTAPEEPLRPPLTETDGRSCIITPRQPFADVTLTGGVLDSEGRLHLELTGLKSPKSAGVTTQIILMLPDAFAARIRLVTAHITAEENETAYAEIAGRTPVIRDNTGQGG